MTTTTPGTSTTFTITEAALAKIREVMAQQDLAADEKNLRLFVDGGGGCCGGGPSFGLAFDRAQDGDTTFAQGGMTVIVDANSLPFCEGATVDWVDAQGVQGFKVSAPALQKQPSGGCGSGSCGSGGCGCGSGGGGGGCGSGGGGGCGSEAKPSHEHGHSHAKSGGGCGCG